MANQIQMRHDTLANWQSTNPVLLLGEIGYVTDKKYIVFGDGATAFTGLTAFSVLPSRTVIITSGALGTLTPTGDTEYFLTAASTATLPVPTAAGMRLTFKNKGNFTTTISAGAGQTIGTTSSTAFALYAQEDYVTLEWDGTSIWYVVATNGPLLSSPQTAALTASVSITWTAIGNGLSLGTVQPGVYDLELFCTLYAGAGQLMAAGIGNVTTPISETGAVEQGGTAPIKISLKNYVLTAAAIIQGIYYWTSGTAGVGYNNNYVVGKITARRVA